MEEGVSLHKARELQPEQRNPPLQITKCREVGGEGVSGGDARMSWTAARDGRHVAGDASPAAQTGHRKPLLHDSATST